MAKTVDPCKVAIYIRWSTDDQADGTTLEVQTEGCRAYVLSQGWTVTEDLIFVDDGYSGGNMDRPALTKMRRMIQDDRIDCVVVLKLDRLSRNVVDMVRLVIDEWGDLCYLKSAREAIDTTNHAGRMFFYTLTSFAEWERATIKDRTFSGKLKRAQEGKNPGMKAPYGYQTANGAFVILPPEAEIVKRIFQRYALGQGMTQIAYDLNGDGIPHRTRPQWDKTEIQRVLRNPIFVGDFVYGARTRNPRKGKQKGQAFWVKNEQPLVVCSGIVPPIISREIWNQTQSIKASRPNPRKKESGRAFSSPYLLSGLLKCSRCGFAMSGRTVSGTGIQYYTCNGRHALGQTVCDAGHIRMEHLDEHVVRLFRARYGRSAERDQHLRAFMGGLAGERDALQQQMLALEVEEGRLEQQGARLRREYREGRITIEELRANDADLKSEQAALATRKEALRVTLGRLDSTLQAQEYTAALAASLDAWEEITPDERKTVLRHFLSHVSAYKSKGGQEIECYVTWRVSEGQAPAASRI